MFFYKGMINKRKNTQAENGFSLIEVIIAMVIFLVAILGIFAAFTYAVSYNSGNSKRSQSLSILQREVERMRSAKFTPTFVDSTMTGGIKSPTNVVSSDGQTYRVEIIVDNDPFTLGVQTEATHPGRTLKEITIVVTPQTSNGSWIADFQARSVLRRVRAN